MNYTKIGLSLIFLIFGISMLIMQITQNSYIVSAGEYFLALKLFFFDLVSSGLIITVAYMLYKEGKNYLELPEKEPVMFTKRMKHLIRDMQKGLWLSVPTFGLSTIIIYGDIQPLVVLTFLPIILGLPWNIPGVLIMILGGMAHGGDETLNRIIFYIGAAWVFIAVTMNGAYISSLNKNKNDTVDVEK